MKGSFEKILFLLFAHIYLMHGQKESVTNGVTSSDLEAYMLRAAARHLVQKN